MIYGKAKATKEYLNCNMADMIMLFYASVV